jgi:hypothetical protein
MTELVTFTSTKQLVVALRAAIKLNQRSSLQFSLLINSQIIVGHRFSFASGVLYRDISPGNVLFTDQLECSGFLHDLNHSEVVLMPGDKVSDDLEEQISRRRKDMSAK